MATPPRVPAHSQLNAEEQHDQDDDQQPEVSHCHDNQAYLKDDNDVTTASPPDATVPTSPGKPAAASDRTDEGSDITRKIYVRPGVQTQVLTNIDHAKDPVSVTDQAVQDDRDYQIQNETKDTWDVESRAGCGEVQHGGSSRDEKDEGGATSKMKSEGNAVREKGGYERLEDLIEELGGIGPFQGLLICAMFGAKMSVAFSVIFMAFAAAMPDWWCQTSANATSSKHNNLYGGWNGSEEEPGLKECQVNGSQCEAFRFSSDAFYGIVSEWNLVCDRHWLSSIITSVQMAGLLVGAMGAGQLADLWGRRNTVYLALLIQAVFSLGAGFSNSLQLFTACRFFTGLAAGGYVVVYFPLPMEFLSSRWRSILGAVPSWPLGVGILSLVAWLIPDWRWLNWIAAAFSGMFLLMYPFTPESVRWLLLHDRTDEAVKVIRTVVTLNRKQMPDLDLIHEVAQREIENEKKRGRRYSYLDLFQNRKLIQSTVFFNFIWFCCGLVYYELSFGVDMLSGSLYINTFLLSIVEIPGIALTVVLNNSPLGRRWTSFLFFTIACVSATAAVITYYVGEHSGTVITVEVLLCKVGLSAAWSCAQVFATESFPTVVRSIGYGACNMSSRVGGIIAPYLALLGSHYFGVLYIVVAVLMGTCALISLLCQETRGRALDDTIDDFLRNQGQETRDEQKQQ